MFELIVSYLIAAYLVTGLTFIILWTKYLAMEVKPNKNELKLIIFGFWLLFSWYYFPFAARKLWLHFKKS